MKRLFALCAAILFANTTWGFSLNWAFPLGEAADSFLYDRMLYGSSAAIANLPGVNTFGYEADSLPEIIIGSEEMFDPYDFADDSHGVWRCIDGNGLLEWARGTQSDESRSSVAIDDFIAGDGVPEIIGGTTSGWNLEAFDRTGRFIWTFPASPVTEGQYAWHSSPAISTNPYVWGNKIAFIGCNALNGVTMENHYGMYCFQCDPSDGIDDGITFDGWSDYPIDDGTDGTDWDIIWYYRTTAPVISTPCAVDMNDDGIADVVFGTGWRGGIEGAMGAIGGEIICLDGNDGTLLWSISTDGTYPAVSASPSAADFDFDGDYEVVVGGYNGTLYFIDGDEDGDGVLEVDEMAQYAHSGSIYGSVAIADIDGDYSYEVIAPIGGGMVKVFQYNPPVSQTLEWYVDCGDSIIGSIAIGGSAHDRAPWACFKQNAARTGFYEPRGENLQIFSTCQKRDGAYLFRIDAATRTKTDSIYIGKFAFASPVIADINGDCQLDVVITGANETYFPEIGGNVPGPDTVFSFLTGIEISGCEDVLFLPHIAEISTQACSLVYTTVCVLNQDSHYVRGLDITNFGFVENSRAITAPNLRMINECPPETAKVDIVLLFDYSTSMDDELEALGLHVPEFIAALSDVNYRISSIIFNGCATDLAHGGICRIVYTDFDGATPCVGRTTGGADDIWATNYSQFECLFDAILDEYTWSPRGSGMEDQYGAVVRANEWLTFRPDAQKVFVLFTDERPIIYSGVCTPEWGEISGIETEYPPDSVINYCLREDIITIPVTPHNGEFSYYAALETAARMYYSGYYRLGPETGGAWFDLYSDDYSELVRGIASEIVQDSCCYQFMYRENEYCTGNVNLQVTVFNSEGVYGVDDSFYRALCAPQLEEVVPLNCHGVTSCSGLGFSYRHTNATSGALVESLFVAVVNGDTVYGTDSTMAFSEASVAWVPDFTWEHGDTVIFHVARAVNTEGCVGSTPPCTFYVDILPPQVLDMIPAPFETLYASEHIDVSARLFDDFTGVNMSRFSASNFTVTHYGDTVLFDSLGIADSNLVTLHNLNFAGDGLYRACVRNLFDSPTLPYCPANNLSEFCWDFWIFSVERLIWFGDSFAAPCEYAEVPLYIDSLSGAEFNSLDVWFSLDHNIAVPMGVRTEGTVAPVSHYELTSVEMPDRWRLHLDWADEMFGPEGGIIARLVVQTNCNANGGDFSIVHIDTAALNLGSPRLNWEDGFYYSLWQVDAWVHDIYFTRTGDTTYHKLTIGATSRATENFDPEYDIVYVEPPPTEVDVFVNLNDATHPSIRKLQRSIMGTVPPDTWIIKAEGETLVTVHWDPHFFPAGLIEMNGYVNMKLDSVFTWRVSETDSLIVRWYLPELARTDLHLCPGWNLISFPYVPVEQTFDHLCPGALGLYGYDAETYSYFIATTPERGMAYWVFAFEEMECPMVGAPTRDYTMPVSRGWNMLGSLDHPISSDSLSTDPHVLLLPSLYGFDCGLHTFVDIGDTIEPGRGFLAFAITNGVVDLPSRTPVLRRAHMPDLSWCGSVRIFDNNAITEALFGISSAATAEIDIADKLIPLMPPNETQNTPLFFSREEQKLMRDVSCAENWNMVLQKAGDVTFALPANITLILKSPDGGFFELTGERTLSLAAGEYVLCSRELANLPKFAILGNYPNPFNSATAISFALDARQQVTVDVCDITGRTISLLAHDIFEPGMHTLNWKSNSPSGIYFVRVTAGKNAAMRKITLLR